jgi:hypothetical protein
MVHDHSLISITLNRSSKLGGFGHASRNISSSNILVKIQQSNPTFLVEGKIYVRPDLSQQVDAMQFANKRRDNYGQQ